MCYFLGCIYIVGLDAQFPYFDTDLILCPVRNDPYPIPMLTSFPYQNVLGEDTATFYQ